MVAEDVFMESGMHRIYTTILAAGSFSLVGCGTAKTAIPHSGPAQEAAGLNSVNHIVFMMQENQTFDHYFGQLNKYRQSLGLNPDLDGIPTDASQLAYDRSTSFAPFHMRTPLRRTASERSPSRSRFGPISTAFHGRPQVREASLLGHKAKPSCQARPLHPKLRILRSHCG